MPITSQFIRLSFSTYKDRMLCTMMIIFIITTLSFCWSCFSLSLFYFKYLPVRRSAAYWSIYTTDMYKYVWIYIYYNLYIVLLMCAWQSLPDKSSLTGNYQPYDNMSLNMIWWISILIQTINIFLKQNCYNMWNWTMNVFSRVYYTFLLPLLLGSIKYFFYVLNRILCTCTYLPPYYVCILTWFFLVPFCRPYKHWNLQ